MATATPWAILLCKWSDHNDEPKPRNFFEDLFTEAGSGTFNMVDYFFAMSHETIDLTGSQVFGWFTLPKAKTDYAGNVGTPPSGQINRQGLVDLARSTAVSGGVDLTQYYGVVVVMNVLTDLFGGGGRQALCDPGSFEPTVLGQEMGHGYGLAHSRVDGSTGDYQDPWDTMSTWDSCYWADNDQYTLIGPGLNAANMRGQGWLDEVRVWRASSTAFSQEIELRPLHRHDMPGFLAAEVPGTPGGFLVEFRMNEAWDAGFPRSAVLVHRFEDNHSYRMIGIGGHSDLVTSTGDPHSHSRAWRRGVWWHPRGRRRIHRDWRPCRARAPPESYNPDSRAGIRISSSGPDRRSHGATKRQTGRNYSHETAPRGLN
jgi:hypothetical protein